MKKAILQGTKIGASIGFSLAIVNAIFVLIAAELSWPPSDPQKIEVFNADFWFSYLIPLFFLSPFWLILPTLIGSATASIFCFIYAKFNLAKVRFVSACAILCIIITGIYFLIIQYLFYGQYTSHIFILVFANPMIEVSLLFFPGIIYLFAGIFASNYLYNKLSKQNAVSPSQ